MAQIPNPYNLKSDTPGLDLSAKESRAIVHLEAAMKCLIAAEWVCHPKNEAKICAIELSLRQLLKEI